MIKNKKELIDRINVGEKFEYLFFWGHHQKKEGLIDKSCFSQWFPSEFIIDNILYHSAEHYMMAQKAKLFNDHTTFKKILNSETPKEAKELGRKVKNFHANIWEKYALDIVEEGNLAKFSQNDNFKKVLLDTDKKILVEASPVDKVWGIGIVSDDINAKTPSNWKGQNYLGFILMKVRDIIFSSSMSLSCSKQPKPNLT